MVVVVTITFTLFIETHVSCLQAALACCGPALIFLDFTLNGQPAERAD
jgi:hypothetical protein